MYGGDDGGRQGYQLRERGATDEARKKMRRGHVDDILLVVSIKRAEYIFQ